MDQCVSTAVAGATAEDFANGHRAMGEAFRNYQPTPARIEAVHAEIIKAINRP